MRKLTFAGFTKKYVVSLSEQKTSAIYALTREAIKDNPRLREPLFLYAITNNGIDTLLNATKSTPLFDDYKRLVSQYDDKTVVKALQDRSSALADEYHKVWDSYLSVSKYHERDNRVKEMIRGKVVVLQRDKGISTYRISKDLGLNNANINHWLKHGGTSMVSIDTARLIMQYVERQPTLSRDILRDH